MSEKIRQLLAQMSALDDELRTALHEQEGRLRYTVEGKRIAFEQSVEEAHRKLRLNVFRWVKTVRPQNYFTAPLIYSLIVPLLFADFCVSLYQAICFPIYGIPKVGRGDYIVFDHQHLAYLNWFEKLHCGYCAYANGLLAYAIEITARTEQYFCPIKHARKRLHSHARYASFLNYGDADDYHARLENFRAALAKEKAAARP